MKDSTLGLLVAGAAVVGYFMLKKSVNQTELNYLLADPQFANIQDVLKKMSGDEVHTIYVIDTTAKSGGTVSPQLAQTGYQIFIKYGIVPS